MVMGKSAHKTEEKNFLQKIETKEDIPLEEIKTTFSDIWDTEKYSIAWTPEELNNSSPKKAEGIFKDKGISLVSVFHIEQAPQIFPVQVEDKFTVEFIGDFPNLTGRIDRIDVNDEIAELKFVSKSPQTDDIKNDIQLTIYDLGFRSKYNRKPSRLKKQWAISTKEPKTITQVCEPRSEDKINRLLFRLERAITGIKKGVFQPAPINAWWCNQKWYGYYLTCDLRP